MKISDVFPLLHDAHSANDDQWMQQKQNQAICYLNTLFGILNRKDASADEIDLAALKIGRLLLKYHPTITIGTHPVIATFSEQEEANVSFRESSQRNEETMKDESYNQFDDYTSLGTVYIKRETERAFLIELPGGEEAWIPKSQTYEPEDLGEGEELEIFVKSWLAEKNGWD